MTIASEMAAYCADLTYDGLPEEVVEYSKKLLLDIVGNSVGGYAWTDEGETIVRGIRALGSDGTENQATVLATGEQLPVEYASLINAAMAHSLDYDNNHTTGVIHIGSSVIPAALGAAEVSKASGRDLLAGIVAGYEVGARLAMACNPPASHDIGFHPTGTCAVFGATAAIGTVQGLSADELENAFGLNGSQASGSRQGYYDGGNAWNKRLHPALAAHSARIATSLAAEGVRGAVAPIEGELGFLQGYSADPRPELATASLGEEYEILNTLIKPYPLCRHVHQTLKLLIELAETEDIDPDEVEGVHVELTTHGYNIVGQPKEEKANLAPGAATDARFSIHFAVALALSYRAAGLGEFRDAVDSGYGPAFTRLMQNTTAEASDEIDAIYPEKFASRITVETTSETYELYGENVKGEPDAPMPWSDLEEKFNELTATLAPERRDQAIEAVGSIEDCQTSELAAPFRRRRE